MSLENEENLEEERKKWTLTKEEYEKNLDSIFNELIITGNVRPSEHPTVVMVGGQSGGGKTLLVNKELEKLPEGAIIIDQDVLKASHPQHEEIQSTYTEREEFLLLKKYVHQIIKDIVDRASERGYNIILETALRNSSKFIEHTKNLREKGYRARLSVLAVSPDEANLSMFTRYCKFLKEKGECRRNTRVDKDSVEKIPLNIEKMEKMGIFDEIVISTRGNEETNFSPIQVYSRRETPNVSATQTYRNIVSGLKVEPEEFETRYLEIRKKLESYGETEQIERLDSFHDEFMSREENHRKSPEFPDFDD